uniref:Uncharacterized protein n=1 Tax=Pipistrellus kuhlii TaxID=59472 RepID=A0A7J7QYE8_PIPKU|nr:hypothetical protein mPipKuh1_008125 [Pipistrellus kuhlii]
MRCPLCQVSDHLTLSAAATALRAGYCDDTMSQTGNEDRGAGTGSANTGAGLEGEGHQLHACTPPMGSVCIRPVNNSHTLMCTDRSTRPGACPALCTHSYWTSPPLQLASPRHWPSILDPHRDSSSVPSPPVPGAPVLATASLPTASSSSISSHGWKAPPFPSDGHGAPPPRFLPSVLQLSLSPAPRGPFVGC